MTYDPNNISIAVKDQTVTGFNDTYKVVLDKEELIELELTFALHSIGKVKGKVLLTQEQMKTLAEEKSK